MKRTPSVPVILEAAILCALLALPWSSSMADDPPFTIKTGLFDQSRPDDLGLGIAGGTETVTVFRPSDSTDHYSNGVVITAFKGWLYCQWQSSAQDEDTQDTWVAYSRSEDGKVWSVPMTLAASPDDGFCSSGGWWVAGDTLVAFINVWPSSVSPRGGYTEYTTSTDGLTWSELKPLPMADRDTLNGIFEQDPHALPDGRIIGAAHFQPGLTAAPVYTDDPSGVRGWTRADFTNLTFAGDVSREIEPSWFLQGDSAVIMIFRDQSNTYYKLASVSVDRGGSWTTPVLTGMPDSRSKQCAGNLPDSSAFMVGNPVNNKTRIPLAVTLSRDGRLFNTAYLLRSGGDDLQELRYAGNAKREGYHYPKSMVWQDYLYVSYSTNKEDVEFTRVPLTSLVIDTSTTAIGTIALPGKPAIEIFTDRDRIVRISLHDSYSGGIYSIFDLNGRLLYQATINNREVHYDMKHHPPGTYVIDVLAGPGRETQLISNW